MAFGTFHFSLRRNRSLKRKTKNGLQRSSISERHRERESQRGRERERERERERKKERKKDR